MKDDDRGKVWGEDPQRERYTHTQDIAATKKIGEIEIIRNKRHHGGGDAADV